MKQACNCFHGAWLKLPKAAQYEAILTMSDETAFQLWIPLCKPWSPLANEQDQHVVRAPELEATRSKDIPACAIRCYPHLKMSNITT